MEKFIKISAGTLLTASLVLAPVLGFAKEKGKSVEAEVQVTAKAEKKEDKKEDKKEKGEKNCLKAVGHLFFGSWVKNSNNLSFGENCFLPFGIAKKFGGNASSTPDTIAPVITNIKSSPKMSEVTITWDTNEKSDGAVFFSTTSGVNTQSSSTPVTSKNHRSKDHKIVLSNLAAGTTYYAVIRSKDASGNTSFSGEFHFTTKTPETSGDVKTPVISSIVGVVSTSTVKIGWKTNEFATSKVYYSVNPSVNTASATFVETTGLMTNHLVTIPGLTNNTKYYFVVESKDAANNLTRSSEFSLTTQVSGTTDITGPVLSAFVTSVSSSTINVNWTTNEPGTSKVYYNAGTSIDTNASTTAFVSNNSLVLSHSVSLPSLATSTQYQFVIESKDALGNTTKSAQMATTTLSI